MVKTRKTTDQDTMYECEGNARAWRESVRISIAALGQGDYFIHDNTHNATHYYNHNLVTPSWSRKLETTTIVGNHTFQK